MRDENQLHAANVELVALDDAEIKYSTVQNWYPGDKDGVGEYTICDKEVLAEERTLKSHGHRSKQGLQLLEIPKLYFTRR